MGVEILPKTKKEIPGKQTLSNLLLPCIFIVLLSTLLSVAPYVLYITTHTILYITPSEPPNLSIPFPLMSCH